MNTRHRVGRTIIVIVWVLCLTAAVAPEPTRSYGVLAGPSPGPAAQEIPVAPDELSPWHLDQSTQGGPLAPTAEMAQRPNAALQAVRVSVASVVASGLTHPVDITHAGDGSGRLFIVEQPGRVRILQNGTLLPTPFLDITALTDDTGEQGLLGLAFHPDYTSSGYFYVNYTRATDGTTVVARYTVSSTNPNIADPGSALPILTVAQPSANHNGGQLRFGPDDMLYIGLGDGGGGGDPLENAQDPTTLLGSILRIDVDGATPYANPPDNPYVGTAGRDEAWAIGLRNPWRFSFDRATGDLYIGDVGQALWEEISFQAAGTPGGLNFGWDCMEGNHQYEWDDACAAATLTGPIAEYGRTEGRSVTGGFVYRGTRYPEMVGRYFYADYVSGNIWSITATPTGFTPPRLELQSGLNISAFGEGESGELYVADRGGGTVRRLIDIGGNTVMLPLIMKGS